MKHILKYINSFLKISKLPQNFDDLVQDILKVSPVQLFKEIPSDQFEYLGFMFGYSENKDISGILTYLEKCYMISGISQQDLSLRANNFSQQLINFCSGVHLGGFSQKCTINISVSVVLLKYSFYPVLEEEFQLIFCKPNEFSTFTQNIFIHAEVNVSKPGSVTEKIYQQKMILLNQFYQYLRPPEYNNWLLQQQNYYQQMKMAKSFVLEFYQRKYTTTCIVNSSYQQNYFNYRFGNKFLDQYLIHKSTQSIYNIMLLEFGQKVSQPFDYIINNDWLTLSQDKNFLSLLQMIMNQIIVDDQQQLCCQFIDKTLDYQTNFTSIIEIFFKLLVINNKLNHYCYSKILPFLLITKSYYQFDFSLIFKMFNICSELTQELIMKCCVDFQSDTVFNNVSQLFQNKLCNGQIQLTQNTSIIIIQKLKKSDLASYFQMLASYLKYDHTHDIKLLALLQQVQERQLFDDSSLQDIMSILQSSLHLINLDSIFNERQLLNYFDFVILKQLFKGQYGQASFVENILERINFNLIIERNLKTNDDTQISYVIELLQCLLFPSLNCCKYDQFSKYQQCVLLFISKQVIQWEQFLQYRLYQLIYPNGFKVPIVLPQLVQSLDQIIFIYHMSSYKQKDIQRIFSCQIFSFSKNNLDSIDIEIIFNLYLWSNHMQLLLNLQQRQFKLKLHMLDHLFNYSLQSYQKPNFLRFNNIQLKQQMCSGIYLEDQITYTLNCQQLTIILQVTIHQFNEKNDIFVLTNELGVDILRLSMVNQIIKIIFCDQQYNLSVESVIHSNTETQKIQMSISVDHFGYSIVIDTISVLIIKQQNNAYFKNITLLSSNICYHQFYFFFGILPLRLISFVHNFIIDQSSQIQAQSSEQQQQTMIIDSVVPNFFTNFYKEQTQFHQDNQQVYIPFSSNIIELRGINRIIQTIQNQTQVGQKPDKSFLRFSISQDDFKIQKQIIELQFEYIVNLKLLYDITSDDRFIIEQEIFALFYQYNQPEIIQSLKSQINCFKFIKHDLASIEKEMTLKKLHFSLHLTKILNFPLSFVLQTELWLQLSELSDIVQLIIFSMTNYPESEQQLAIFIYEQFRHNQMLLQILQQLIQIDLHYLLLFIRIADYQLMVIIIEILYNFQQLFENQAQNLLFIDFLKQIEFFDIIVCQVQLLMQPIIKNFMIYLLSTDISGYFLQQLVQILQVSTKANDFSLQIVADIIQCASTKNCYFKQILIKFQLSEYLLDSIDKKLMSFNEISTLVNIIQYIYLIMYFISAQIPISEQYKCYQILNNQLSIVSNLFSQSTNYVEDQNKYTIIIQLFCTFQKYLSYQTLPTFLTLLGELENCDIQKFLLTQISVYFDDIAILNEWNILLYNPLDIVYKPHKRKIINTPLTVEMVVSEQKDEKLYFHLNSHYAKDLYFRNTFRLYTQQRQNDHNINQKFIYFDLILKFVSKLPDEQAIQYLTIHYDKIIISQKPNQYKQLTQQFFNYVITFVKKPTVIIQFILTIIQTFYPFNSDDQSYDEFLIFDKQPIKIVLNQRYHSIFNKQYQDFFYTLLKLLIYGWKLGIQCDYINNDVESFIVRFLIRCNNSADFEFIYQQFNSIFLYAAWIRPQSKFINQLLQLGLTKKLFIVTDISKAYKCIVDGSLAVAEQLMQKSVDEEEIFFLNVRQSMNISYDNIQFPLDTQINEKQVEMQSHQQDNSFKNYYSFSQFVVVLFVFLCNAVDQFVNKCCFINTLLIQKQRNLDCTKELREQSYKILLIFKSFAKYQYFQLLDITKNDTANFFDALTTTIDVFAKLCKNEDNHLFLFHILFQEYLVGSIAKDIQLIQIIQYIQLLNTKTIFENTLYYKKNHIISTDIISFSNQTNLEQFKQYSLFSNVNYKLFCSQVFHQSQDFQYRGLLKSHFQIAQKFQIQLMLKSQKQFLQFKDTFYLQVFNLLVNPFDTIINMFEVQISDFTLENINSLLILTPNYLVLAPNMRIDHISKEQFRLQQFNFNLDTNNRDDTSRVSKILSATQPFSLEFHEKFVFRVETDLSHKEKSLFQQQLDSLDNGNELIEQRQMFSYDDLQFVRTINYSDIQDYQRYQYCGRDQSALLTLSSNLQYLITFCDSINSPKLRQRNLIREKFTKLNLTKSIASRNQNIQLQIFYQGNAVAQREQFIYGMTYLCKIQPVIIECQFQEQQEQTIPANVPSYYLEKQVQDIYNSLMKIDYSLKYQVKYSLFQMLKVIEKAGKFNQLIYNKWQGCEPFRQDEYVGQLFNLLLFKNQIDRKIAKQQAITNIAGKQIIDDNQLYHFWLSNTNIQLLFNLQWKAQRNDQSLQNSLIIPWTFSNYPHAVQIIQDNIILPNSNIEEQVLQQRLFSYPPSSQLEKERHMLVLKYQETQQFQLASLPSSAANQIYFSVRLLHGEKQLRILQSGKYDAADRMYSSLEKAWQCVISGNITDNKEMTSDLLFFPDIHQNLYNFRFGKLQNGASIEAVDVGDMSPEQFTVLLQSTLNSIQTSQLLHYWIDQQFGINQRTEKSCNIYPSQLYSQYINLNSTTDEVFLSYTEIDNFGIIPFQLFKQQFQCKQIDETDLYLLFQKYQYDKQIITTFDFHVQVGKKELQSFIKKLGNSNLLMVNNVLLYFEAQYDFVKQIAGKTIFQTMDLCININSDDKTDFRCVFDDVVKDVTIIESFLIVLSSRKIITIININLQVIVNQYDYSGLGFTTQKDSWQVLCLSDLNHIVVRIGEHVLITNISGYPLIFGCLQNSMNISVFQYYQHLILFQPIYSVLVIYQIDALHTQQIKSSTHIFGQQHPFERDQSYWILPAMIRPLEQQIDSFIEGLCFTEPSQFNLCQISVVASIDYQQEIDHIVIEHDNLIIHLIE